MKQSKKRKKKNPQPKFSQELTDALKRDIMARLIGNAVLAVVNSKEALPQPEGVKFTLMQTECDACRAYGTSAVIDGEDIFTYLCKNCLTTALDLLK